MKLLLAFGAIGAALYQLISYLITRSKFDSLPSATGVVLDSKVDHYYDTDGRRVYEANIKYKYEIDGEEYESNNCSLKSFQLFPNFEYEAELVSKYKQGDEIDVRYNSINHNIAYLSVAPLSILSSVGVVILFLAAVSYLIYSMVLSGNA